MALASRLMGSGMAAQAAVNIVGDVSAPLTATGSGQSTALPLSNVVNYVTTTASSTGVQLFGQAISDQLEVYNAGANALSVYGLTGDTIQGGSANAAFSIAANKGAIFRRVTATAWVANLSN